MGLEIQTAGVVGDGGGGGGGFGPWVAEAALAKEVGDGNGQTTLVAVLDPTKQYMIALQGLGLAPLVGDLTLASAVPGIGLADPPMPQDSAPKFTLNDSIQGDFEFTESGAIILDGTIIKSAPISDYRLPASGGLGSAMVVSQDSGAIIADFQDSGGSDMAFAVLSRSAA